MSTQSARTAPVIGEESTEIIKGLRIAIALDKSGSMGDPSVRLPGKTKWQELEETVVALAREAVDAGSVGGITLIPFSNTANQKHIVTAEEIKSVFHEYRPGGGTFLASALNEIENIARSTKEDVLGIVYTDGIADDKDAVYASMNKAGKEFGRPRIGFCLIQVGNDAGAKAFLEDLDDNLDVDVSSTVPFELSGELSLAKIAWLARQA